MLLFWSNLWRRIDASLVDWVWQVGREGARGRWRGIVLYVGRSLCFRCDAEEANIRYASGM